MKREDIQEEFRQEFKEPISTLNKSEVGVNINYVVWLEKRILALKNDSVVSSIISYNLYDEIKKKLNLDSLATHEWISLQTVEFNKKYSHIKNGEWEQFCLKNDFSDFEEVVLNFTIVKLEIEKL